MPISNNSWDYLKVNPTTLAIEQPPVNKKDASGTKEINAFLKNLSVNLDVHDKKLDKQQITVIKDIIDHDEKWIYKTLNKLTYIVKSFFGFAKQETAEVEMKKDNIRLCLELIDNYAPDDTDSQIHYTARSGEFSDSGIASGYLDSDATIESDEDSYEYEVEYEYEEVNEDQNNDAEVQGNDGKLEAEVQDNDEKTEAKVGVGVNPSYREQRPPPPALKKDNTSTATTKNAEDYNTRRLSALDRIEEEPEFEPEAEAENTVPKSDNTPPPIPERLKRRPIPPKSSKSDTKTERF